MACMEHKYSHKDLTWLLRKWGLEGLGAFWYMVELVSESESGYLEMSESAMDDLGFELRTGIDLTKIIHECADRGIASIDGETFSFPFVREEMEKAERLKARNRANAQKRWGKKSLDVLQPMPIDNDWLEVINGFKEVQPNPDFKELQRLEDYYSDLGKEMILHAIKLTKQIQFPNSRYLFGVLDRCIKLNITDVAEAEKYSEEMRQKRQAKEPEPKQEQEQKEEIRWLD